MRIFLAPRSNETSYKNFVSTIEEGRDYSSIASYLDPEGKRVLGQYAKVFAWGNKEAKKTSWSKMEEGDLVLFYKRGAFVHAGRLLYKQYSRDLGLALWPAKRNQQPWICVFFLTDLRPIYLPVPELNKLSGGAYKLDRVQGFMPLKEAVVTSILSRFGTVDKFLDQYRSEAKTGGPPSQVADKSTGSRGKGKLFEKEVVALLKELEFEDVDGARNDFLIGGVQVDAVAGWHHVLLVFECTTRRTLGPKDLSEKLSSFRGKMELIKEGLASHATYKKYRKIWFILATKDIEVRDVDIDLARREPKLYIWYGDFLSYYADLYRFLKPYAKYDLLGELGVKPLDETPVRIPAIKTVVENKIMYTFLINPRDLLEFAYVARRGFRSEEYYQRILDESRLGRIGRYIKEGGIFPNNLILAFREDLLVTFDEWTESNEHRKGEFPPGTQFGILSFPRDFRSCWIIDGQHRLYAFAGLSRAVDFKMPVTAFQALPVTEQRKYFLDINRNQKPVDPDLLWDLLGDTPASTEGRISNSVKHLNTHRDSPLRRLIFYPSTGSTSKKGKIKISALCAAVKKNRLAERLTLQNIGNPLYSEDPDTHRKNIAYNLSRYFMAVRNAFPKNWNLDNKGFVLSNGGVTVMIALFERILSRIAEKSSSTPTPLDYQEYLLPLRATIELQDKNSQAALRLKTTSEGGKTELVNAFVRTIRRETGDPRFGGDLKTESWDREFNELESLLKELIRRMYANDGSDWLARVVDDDVYSQAQKNAKKNLNSTNPEKFYLGLTLGQCFKLIDEHFGKFEQVFVSVDDNSFSNRNDFLAASRWISQMRGKYMHATGARVKQGDVDILRSFLQRMKSCTETALSISPSDTADAENEADSST